ncbi:MAG: T9SS type A sorting domain-containing protein, partial [Flavobacteriales bacterium]
VPLQFPNGLTAGSVVDNGNIGFYFVENAIEVGVNVSSWNTATPGFGGTYVISLENAGTLPAIVDITLDFPASQTIQEIPALNGVAGVLDGMTNTITWSGVEMSGFEILAGYVGVVNSVTTPLGSIVNIVAGAFVNNGTDVYLPNNTYALAQTVVGSYDPNNKLNQPEGVGAQGEMAPTNDPFTYTINFQNTGTAPAFTVRVEDQLDSDLDWSSFEMITASHNYSVQMEDGHLVWTFNNIMLPDSTTNEPESHGHIIYRIKPIANKPLGTVFENTAYIYFDFNEPIITNTTVNAFAVVQSVDENELSQNVRVYPNPTSGEFTLVSELLTGDARVSIYDVAGREVYSQNTTAVGSVLLTQKMEPGHYLVRINNARSNQTVKLIVR